VTDIRPYRPDDLEALYRIALATGDSGGDAAHLYGDLKLVGHLYAAPYAILNPQTAFVAEDEEGVAGYILGAADTRAFEALAEECWWPTLRPFYRDPVDTLHSQWSADQRLSYLIHHPWRAPARIVEPFPSHLHIDLLPRLQGRGLGRRLMDLWLATVRALGSKGAHLGVSPANARAIRFYRAYGLTEPVLAKPPPAGVLWFAVELAGD
jgi:ribosomal protein S18 acetylase RimI-like enzyme